MFYIPTDWDVPYYNMALEGYLLSDDCPGSFLFFYIHKPSIIVGNHQNTIEEINFPYVMQNGITVARRVSGGGAVYHDYGNLNFSFIVEKGESASTIDFKPFTDPVIHALSGLGLNATLSGRNDILIDGKKFSGNAQYISKTKVLSHGTLMFDVNIEAMLESLNVDEEKITSKAIRSVKSRVANVREALKTDMDVFEFRAYLIERLIEETGATERKLTDEENALVEKSVAEKYSTWEHNYGSSPPFRLKKRSRFDGVGIIEIGLNVEGGVITKASLSGDFFTNEPIENLEAALIGKRMEYSEVASLPEASRVIAGFSAEGLCELIFG